MIQGALTDNEEFDGKGADQYGAQIMIHRTGPHPTPIRYVYIYMETHGFQLDHTNEYIII